MSSRKPAKLDVILLLVAFLIPSSFQVPTPALPLGSFYITAVEGIIFILLTRWVLDLLASGKGYRHPLDRWVLWLLGYLVFSLILGSSRYGWSKALADFRNFLPIFLYFWVLRFFWQEQVLNVTRKWIFVVLLIAASYQVFLFLFFMDNLRAYARTYGISFSDVRIYFDNTLLLFIAYSGYLIGYVHLIKKDRRLIYAILVLNALMLLLMQVRNFWVAFGLVALWTILRLRETFFRSHFLLRVGFAVLLVGSLSLLVTSMVPVEFGGLENVAASIGKRSSSLLNLRETLFEIQSAPAETESIGTRVVTAKATWEDFIVKSPLFGTGFGGELPLLSPYGGIVLMKYIIDNGYFTLLAKFGFVGTLPFAILLYKIFSILLRVARSSLADPEEKLLAHSFMATIIAMLIASIFSAIAIRQASLLAWAVIIAETCALQRGLQQRQCSLRPPQHPSNLLPVDPHDNLIDRA